MVLVIEIRCAIRGLPLDESNTASGLFRKAMQAMPCEGGA